MKSIWVCISITIGLMLLLSTGLIAGGVDDRNKYETVSCVLTKVSGCIPLCVYVPEGDSGGGGGGGGGEKRTVEDFQCKGVEFNCDAKWTVGNQTFQTSGLLAKWWTDDFSCDKMYAGMSATVLITVANPGVAIEIDQPGYSRPPIILIVGIVLLVLVVYSCVCAGFCYRLFKKDDGANFVTV
jgi:hypothetical protein